MSKFAEYDAYLNKDRRYSLLPFKFENLEEEEVVITNMVGEYVVIKRNKLDDLVNHSLDSKDKDYIELRSKHFIAESEDKSSFELLSLKLRTKYANLSNFTNLHMFVVTLRCDHSCQYCQVSRQSENKAAFDMTFETADKSLDLVFQSPNPSIKIEFQGGEPLLNFELIKHIVLSAELRNITERRNLQFVITTTLTLLTDEILRFCKEHTIYLSSSLDGPEDLHNKNRPRPDRNSHELFVKGLSKARDVLGIDGVSALMTTSPSSLTRVKGIIDEYIRLGFNGIFLRHLSPYGFALKTKSYQAYGVEKWLEFYKEGLDYIIDINKKGIFFSEYFSTILLSKMLTSEETGYVDLMSPAGIGIAAVTFNYDGDVYASDESRMLKEMGDTSFKIGNVHKNSYKEIFTSDALLNALDDSFALSAPMCTDCAFETYCGADPVFHYATFGDYLGKKPESEFCKRMMGAIKHLIMLMEKDEDTKEIFLRWVNKC
jgi:uncharacterized protein